MVDGAYESFGTIPVRVTALAGGTGVVGNARTSDTRVREGTRVGAYASSGVVSFGTGSTNGTVQPRIALGGGCAGAAQFQSGATTVNAGGASETVGGRGAEIVGQAEGSVDSTSATGAHHVLVVCHSAISGGGAELI